MKPVAESDKEQGMKWSEMTLQELFALMSSHENEEFIIHVEFPEEVQDEQE